MIYLLWGIRYEVSSKVDVSAWVALVLLGLLKLPWILLGGILLSPYLVWLYLRRDDKSITLGQFVRPIIIMCVKGIGKG